MGRGGEQEGAGGEDLGAKPEEWETGSGPEPLGPAVSRALPIHPSTCLSPDMHNTDRRACPNLCPLPLTLLIPWSPAPCLGRERRGGRWWEDYSD